MSCDKIGLILEGGGMRGAFTAGVLDCFMDNNLYINPIYCVSAGACHAVNYVSHQRGRSMKIYLDYCCDKRYMSMRNLILKKSFFGSDFIFDYMPKMRFRLIMHLITNPIWNVMWALQICLQVNVNFFQRTRP